jgi:tyrosinase
MPVSRAHLTGNERKAYTKAVNCLLSRPSKFAPGLLPGVKNRYDDFVAQHMNQTTTSHGTANFLSWHRYFVYSYETALREECGYTGYHPYWNWFTHQDDPRKSPVFDGSDTSLSGDGAFFLHNGSSTGSGAFEIPSGNGGGCVTSGPFKEWVPLFPS